MQVVVTTVYDPSDGTGEIGQAMQPWPEGPGIVRALNESLVAVAHRHGALVADVHGAFLGHGALAGDPAQSEPRPSNVDLWYCSGVEPNAWGAHQIRAVWWDTLQRAGWRPPAQRFSAPDDVDGFLREYATVDVLDTVHGLQDNDYVLSQQHGAGAGGASFVYTGSAEVCVFVDKGQWGLLVAPAPGTKPYDLDHLVCALLARPYWELFPKRYPRPVVADAAAAARGPQVAVRTAAGAGVDHRAR
jgi:hypothetical protein